MSVSQSGALKALLKEWKSVYCLAQMTASCSEPRTELTMGPKRVLRTVDLTAHSRVVNLAMKTVLQKVEMTELMSV